MSHPTAKRKAELKPSERRVALEEETNVGNGCPKRRRVEDPLASNLIQHEEEREDKEIEEVRRNVPAPPAWYLVTLAHFNTPKQALTLRDFYNFAAYYFILEEEISVWTARIEQYCESDMTKCDCYGATEKLAYEYIYTYLKTNDTFYYKFADPERQKRYIEQFIKEEPEKAERSLRFPGDYVALLEGTKGLPPKEFDYQHDKLLTEGCNFEHLMGTCARSRPLTRKEIDRTAEYRHTDNIRIPFNVYAYLALLNAKRPLTINEFQAFTVYYFPKVATTRKTWLSDFEEYIEQNLKAEQVRNYTRYKLRNINEETIAVGNFCDQHRFTKKEKFGIRTEPTHLMECTSAEETFRSIFSGKAGMPSRAFLANWDGRIAQQRKIFDPCIHLFANGNISKKVSTRRYEIEGDYREDFPILLRESYPGQKAYREPVCIRFLSFERSVKEETIPRCKFLENRQATSNCTGVPLVRIGYPVRKIGSMVSFRRSNELDWLPPGGLTNYIDTIYLLIDMISSIIDYRPPPQKHSKIEYCMALLSATSIGSSTILIPRGVHLTLKEGDQLIAVKYNIANKKVSGECRIFPSEFLPNLDGISESPLQIMISMEHIPSIL